MPLPRLRKSSLIPKFHEHEHSTSGPPTGLSLHKQALARDQILSIRTHKMAVPLVVAEEPGGKCDLRSAQPQGGSQRENGWELGVTVRPWFGAWHEQVEHNIT